MEELQKTVTDSACALYGSAKSTVCQWTAPLRKEATALLTDTVRPAIDRYQQLHDTALAHYAATEELVLSRVDEGVILANEHPNTAGEWRRRQLRAARVASCGLCE